MLDKVALLGRPNVGKSTLFNRLIRSNRAITHDMPGITRDRMEGFVRPKGHTSFILIDTGGVSIDGKFMLESNNLSQGFQEEILSQAKIAIEEAKVLCLVVDAKEGLTPFDESLATYIRKQNKPSLVIVNKVDGIEHEDQMLAEFHILGFPLLAVSAAHGHNVRYLEEVVADLLPIPLENEVFEELDLSAEQLSDIELEGTSSDRAIKLCLVGKPNAGKSSLVNALTDSNRMIVSDVAGTTRDSVDVSCEKEGVHYVFIDTAGVRKRAKVINEVEKFSVNSAIKSTTKAKVTMLVLDAVEGLTGQDKKLIDLLGERKTPFLVLVNKWDLINTKERSKLKKEYEYALSLCPHVPILFVSANSKEGLNKILPLAKRLRKECLTRIGTGQLNRAMEEVISAHQPAVVRRARPRFFYMTQAEIEPPTFVFFVSDATRITEPYERYLEKSLRKIFAINYAPVRVKFRSTHNKEKRHDKTLRVKNPNQVKDKNQDK